MNRHFKVLIICNLSFCSCMFKLLLKMFNMQKRDKVKFFNFYLGIYMFTDANIFKIKRCSKMICDYLNCNF